jgi:3-deoxy-7-phosphoheptulonate synthase
MQNFNLLKEVGSYTKKPILLKRGMSATLQELLMSAEYIMASGNPNVILCERGIRTFETALRNTLDLGVVTLLHKLSHLPVVIDPSHATGHSWMVSSVAVAAAAIGADGLIIEVHNDPPRAKCDGAQSQTPEAFAKTVDRVNKVRQVLRSEEEI